MRFFLLYALFCFSFSFSQGQENVDFTKIDVEILPLIDSQEIYGKGTYYFELTAKVDSIFLDAANMKFLYVSLNGKEVPFANSTKRLAVAAPQELGKHQLFLRYATKPKQTVYFINTNSSKQIWTQGQGKYTSHWLPSIDSMEDKIEFDLSFLVEEGYDVISNGELKGSLSEDGLVQWDFDMTQPMSSYLAAFVIGNFEKKVVKSNSGVPLELYYEPKDSLKYEPTYRYSKEIFDFLENEIGVAYPWQNYKQVPVQDFLYAGMENTSCTIFSNQFVIDSTAFVDKNYVNVNAHELAHQWFGNLVTEVSGEHHWLHEGFATYYAYLAEKELFGEDYFYWKLYDTAKTLHQLSDDDQGESLTDQGAGSLTFYEKGAWALVMLRERVGDSKFRKGIQSYLKTFAFKNATIQDFLNEMERASNEDLESFGKQWLDNKNFLWDEVRSHLASKNESLKTYFELQKGVETDGILENRIQPILLARETSKELKRQLIFDYVEQLSDSNIQKILNNEALEVRRAIAIAKSKIPKNLQVEFESLLMDKSYVTQETLLFKLWEAFPDKRSSYLEQMDGVVGLPNKNVRQLWLTLALVTPEFQTERKKEFYNELNGLTEPQHNFEVRQLAFQYLSQIQALSDDSIKNLVLASEHHAWQFKKSSRNLTRQLYNTPEGKIRLQQLEAQWPEDLQQSFKKVIEP